MKTRSGIYYDLTLSQYRLRVGNLRYIFSSQSHLEKFKIQCAEHRIKNNEKLKSKYGIEIHLNILADLILYMKIETRGFLIQNESGDFVCKENLILSGEKMTLKKLSD